MSKNILAAIDMGGLAVCIGVGTYCALNGVPAVAAGFLLAALAFLLSFTFNIDPAAFTERGLGILQALTFSAVLLIVLGLTARLTA